VTTAAAPEIVRVAERALLVRCRDADLIHAVARAHALAARFRLAAAGGEPLRHHGRENARRFDRDKDRDEGRDEKFSVKAEWILGAGNLLVRFDDSCTAREVEAFATRFDDVVRISPLDEGLFSDRTHSFAVRFGHEEGPDLSEVARETGLGEADVVARFCAAEYTVAFLGFAPGFPYLIGLPPELEVARLASPRTAVPAGSVAIAGPFAGVYPSSTPGGWRLIGWTEAALFDPAADPPARLAPGDRVRFVAT
jgi:KipI family sensor histidine kinase inhibitor